VHSTHAKRGSNQRARAIDVCAVNCLFAEFDTKDFGNSKDHALAHIHGLALPPSVVVDSGGGYHCYCLLDAPYPIASDEDRARVDRIQKSWVAFVGSDDGAKDLARVLRVPGTTNGKYTPPRPVTFLSTNFEDLYSLDDLEKISYSPPSPSITDSSDAGAPHGASGPSTYAKAALNGELTRVRSAKPSTRNTTLNKAAYAIGRLVGAGVLDQAAVEYELLNAALATGLPEQEALRTIRSGLTAGMAKPRQMPNTQMRSTPSAVDLNRALAVQLTEDAIDAKLREAPLTDPGNAECLELLYGNKLRWDNTRRRWLIWTSERWQVDDDNTVRWLMLQTVRARRNAFNAINPATKDSAQGWNFARSSENARKVRDALESAQSLPAFKTTIVLYDCDPMLANAGGVTLDLRTGTARDNAQTDYITRQLGAYYDADAVCPRWLKFLNEIFTGNRDLMAYIQRAVGYSLTGDTSEQKLFLCHGGGANGKSVFLTTLGELLGEYAGSTPFDTFDADNEQARNDLAKLKAARLVTVIETNEDRRLNEARVKSVTGCDVITAEAKYENPFDYRPQFKIWMAMNHKPVIRQTDRGIWRRIQLIPFMQSFEGREDRQLERKLRAELPGILNWALEGLREWHKQGLNPPAIVTEATEQYRQESDLIGQWLVACTTDGIKMEMKVSDGYNSFKEWCDMGKTTPGRKWWTAQMEERGYRKSAPTRTGVYFYGVGLVVTP
jgi:putative DNA primase/helicase